jgi:hypothetical protein
VDAKVDRQDTPDTPNPNLFYRHRKRSEWGVGIFLWERDDKRAFRFADGEVRLFKQGFYDLMVPTVAPADGSADRLRVELAANTNLEIQCTVGDQLMLLLGEFPKGFAGPRWLDKHRGRGRRLKRHRDASIHQARELLAPGRIAKLDDAGAYRDVLDSLIEVLSHTDLVPGAHLAALRATKPTAALAGAIRGIAEDPEKNRLTGLQQALINAGGPATSWAVITAPAALLAPREHLCVRPSLLAQQGKIALGQFSAPKHPSAANYARYLELARRVEQELGELGYPPLDLLDLYDFMALTLRPGAHEQLERIHLQADEPEPSPT